MKHSVLIAALLMAYLFCGKVSVLNGQTTVDDPIFVKVDEAPVYPGGDEALSTYITENMRSIPDMKGEVVITMSGKKYLKAEVMCQFVINKDGSVSDIEVLNSPDERCSAEAIRLLKNMKKWIPGKVKGKAVRCRLTEPILFITSAN